MNKKRLIQSLSRNMRKIWMFFRLWKSTEKQKRHIFDLWLACHTQQEIANAVGVSQSEVDRQSAQNGKVSNLGKSDQAAAEHAVDFEQKTCNIWKQQKKSDGTGNYGNSEINWLDNLLYRYTKPFDIVIDPFAGNGSTIDLCRKRFRRYWVSDRKPIAEREHEIRKHDITSGLPNLARWKDVKLVYLDPPYWKQTKSEYSKDPTDLANMDLNQFKATLANLIISFADKLKNGEPSYIALIIPPKQYSTPEHQCTDHLADMIHAVNLPTVPQIVSLTKEFLVLTREIIVWKVK